MTEPALPPGARDLDTKLVAALERLGQALRTEQRAAGNAYGVNLAQLQVLLRLAVDPPARRRAAVLADLLGVTRPTMSDTLAALERKGLLHRDTRTLTLTEQGRQVADAATGWDRRVVARLAAMPAGKKADGLRFLLDLIAELNRDGVITVARTCVTCRFFRVDAAGPGRHHCALLDAPLATSDLRVDCPEHEAA